MEQALINICLLIVLTPLITSIIVGLNGKRLGPIWVHRLTIFGVFIAFLLALYVTKIIIWNEIGPIQKNLFTWASGKNLFPYKFHIGFLIDQLTAYMLVVVTFVSFLVHIYSIGYMSGDPGYHRFFSYISFFTFSMLLLVSSNNFLQLFIGWEGVGLASYLLIGFWYQRESALQGSLKAFLVNRVGDFGFLLGIGLILAYTNSLDYKSVFEQVGILKGQNITISYVGTFSLITVICLFLFWGAMGKSAQIPLHVWLPESMEGPTPISALIHAATMVTAGVFMVARMSPLFEHSETALSFILLVGATGGLFMGLVALVINDIKRVIAYSTLSQLGYMMSALGASAYSAGIFHLGTHACFKALLFLGAGSVILAMHHEQDMRKMGGLYRFMPITYWTYLIGCLALCAIPPFSGFYSKDIIIEAVKETHIYGSSYAYYCLTIGAFVTALYTFRSFFMTFHGKPRMGSETQSHLHESPFEIWFPLVVLAVLSTVMGISLVSPMLFSTKSLLGSSVFVLPKHNVLSNLASHFSNPLYAIKDSLVSPVFWLSIAGIGSAWVGYILAPQLPKLLVKRGRLFYEILVYKYGFDKLYEKLFVNGGLFLGKKLSQISDNILIDGLMIDGVAKKIFNAAKRSRLIQTGYLFHYVAFMIIGTFALLYWIMRG